jgi:hypothetical protein
VDCKFVFKNQRKPRKNKKTKIQKKLKNKNPEKIKKQKK